MSDSTPTDNKVTPQEIWPPVFRASILGAAISKQVNYVGFADKRAATVITVNSFLIPIALSGLDRPHWRWGILIRSLGLRAQHSVCRGEPHPKALHEKRGP